jgi:hypothetical protein
LPGYLETAPLEALLLQMVHRDGLVEEVQVAQAQGQGDWEVGHQWLSLGGLQWLVFASGEEEDLGVVVQGEGAVVE